MDPGTAWYSHVRLLTYGCCPGMLKAEDGSSKRNQPYAGYVPALLCINHLTLSLSPQHLWRPSCPPPSVVIGASSLCYLIPVSQRRPRQSVVGEGYITCSLLPACSWPHGNSRWTNLACECLDRHLGVPNPDNRVIF
jgi:hypothetical protein